MASKSHVSSRNFSCSGWRTKGRCAWRTREREPGMGFTIYDLRFTRWPRGLTQIVNRKSQIQPTAAFPLRPASGVEGVALFAVRQQVQHFVVGSTTAGMGLDKHLNLLGEAFANLHHRLPDGGDLLDLVGAARGHYGDVVKLFELAFQSRHFSIELFLRS